MYTEEQERQGHVFVARKKTKGHRPTGRQGNENAKKYEGRGARAYSFHLLLLAGGREILNVE